MAWFSNFSREQGTNHYTIRITSDSDGDNRGDYRHDVQFTSLVPSDENRDAGGKVFETIRFEEDTDFTEFLGRDAASYLNLSDEIVAQGFTITLDVSAIDSDELLMHLPRHSIHYRADKNPRTLENISEGSIGSKITGIIGTSSDDNIIGTSLNETLRGGDGDDYLQGGGGDDILLGGAGDDIITSGSGHDTMNGGVGTDTAWFRWISANEETSVDRELLSIAENRYDQNEHPEYASYKNEADDFRDFYYSYQDRIEGQDVSLWVNLEDGFSYSYFDMDYEVLEERGLTDSYESGLRRNTLIDIENITADARAGMDEAGRLIYGSVVVEGNDGANQIIGGVWHDWLYGNGGADTLHGAAGNDYIFGGAGIDVINGGWGGDHLFGDGGDDILAGNTGSDHIYGGAGADTIYGGEDHDYIDGGSGSDQIDAGDGRDIIQLSGGNDIITGGGGEDIYLVSIPPVSGQLATITDFNPYADKVTFYSDTGDENTLAGLNFYLDYDAEAGHTALKRGGNDADLIIFEGVDLSAGDIGSRYFEITTENNFNSNTGFLWLEDRQEIRIVDAMSMDNNDVFRPTPPISAKDVSMGIRNTMPEKEGASVTLKQTIIEADEKLYRFMETRAATDIREGEGVTLNLGNDGEGYYLALNLYDLSTPYDLYNSYSHFETRTLRSDGHIIGQAAKLGAHITDIIATSGHDFISANEKDNLIRGENGNDILVAGAGTDTLWYRWISAGKETTTSEALLAITEDNNYSGDYATEAAAFKALSEASGNFGGNEVTLWVDLNEGYAFSYFRIDEGVFDGAPVPDQYQEGLRKNIITNTENVTANARAGVDNNGEKIIASVILEGNADANQLIGGFGHDWIWGNGGDDRIHSKNNDDTIYGGDGGDVINAGWGDDILFGEDGADRLIGNKGQDVLHGGAGNDTLIGGQGADKFVIDLTTAGDNGSDIIEDFIKVRDKIVFVTDNGDEADLAAQGVEITYTNTGSEKYSEIIDSADTSTVYAKIMNKNLTNDGYDIGDSSGYFELVSATDEIVPSEV